MTPKEALEIVTAASGMAPLNRNDHAKVLEAVEVLKKAVKEDSKNG